MKIDFTALRSKRSEYLETIPSFESRFTKEQFRGTKVRKQRINTKKKMKAYWKVRKKTDFKKLIKMIPNVFSG